MLVVLRQAFQIIAECRHPVLTVVFLRRLFLYMFLYIGKINVNRLLPPFTGTGNGSLSGRSAVLASRQSLLKVPDRSSGRNQLAHVVELLLVGRISAVLFREAAVNLLGIVIALLLLVVRSKHRKRPAVKGSDVQILLESFLRLRMVSPLVIAHGPVFIVGDIRGVNRTDLLEALVRLLLVAAADVILAHQVQGLHILGIPFHDLLDLFIGGSQLVA